MPEVRLVLAISLDGRLAPPGGGAAQLGGRGDRRVLEESLAWADGCLIGARTLRLHGTTCLIRDADLLAQRRRSGRPPQPMALVVSRSGLLDPGLPFFDQPLERGLIAPPQALPAGGPGIGYGACWRLGPWPGTLADLAVAGLGRLVLLGGSQLAASLLADGVVQELQLTLCPQLLGGGHTWLPPEALPAQGHWQLQECRPIGGEGEVLLRYSRLRGAAAG